MASPFTAPVPIDAFLAAAGPIVDVRSPAEFAQGHIPGATNLPLFDNAERAEIGTLYKQQGRQAAVLRGLALVGPRMERLAEALAAASTLPPPPEAGSGLGGAEPPASEPDSAEPPLPRPGTEESASPPPAPAPPLLARRHALRVGGLAGRPA